MTTKHKKVLAEAKKLVAEYKRSVRALQQFKLKYCRAGDKIGKTGTRYAPHYGFATVYVKRPDYVVVMRNEDKDWSGEYPLVKAIEEDIEK